MEANATATAASQGAPAIAVLFLTSLIVLVVFGNFLVIVTVLIDKKLRTVTTNKFIASLAVSDLLIGLVVMPLSLYSKMNEDEWTLGYEWCQFHLVTGVFSTTASIVHLVAISLDRYFAIMFPTEYQRHSVSTSTLPYVVIIWLMAFAVSSTLFMEQRSSFQEICWIDNPQYIVLSSFLSFFLPGAIVVYMYVKIFKKLRTHQLYMFGQLNQSRRVTKSGEKRRSLPRVIIEEVRSRRGSRLSQSGSASGSPTRRSSGKSDRSPSQPEIHVIALPQQRWRSPTICAETFEHDREMAAKKRVSIVPDPPSVDVSSIILQEEHQGSRQTESERFRKVSEERRKYSEERKRTNEERRKLSEDRRRKMSMEGAIPIMAAFNKAFKEVKAGRRRGSLIDDLDTIHTSLCTKLSTVLDTEDGVEMSDLSQRLSVSTEGQVEAIPEAHEEPVGESIDDQNNSLLCNVTAECPLLQVPPAHRKLRPVDSLKLESKLTTKPTGGLLMVPGGMAVATPPLSPNNATLKVPKLFECPTPSCGSAPSNSSHSSYTSASGSSDTYRRISMNSYGSSLTDATDSTFEVDSRRSSAWSTIRTAVLGEHKDSTGSPVKISVEENGKKASTISRGKLRRIATQVTRAIRRKRRESLAIRRESRATRVVAAILIAFLICWLPYFMVSVYRGICTGMLVPININFHYQIFVITSWLGYAHSCFNPLIYMCLNKNFRRTLRRILAKHREFQGQALA